MKEGPTTRNMRGAERNWICGGAWKKYDLVGLVAGSQRLSDFYLSCLQQAAAESGALKDR